MNDSSSDNVQRYKRHRESLLPLIDAFRTELAALATRLLGRTPRLIAEVADLDLRAYREREHLEYLTSGDKTARRFQKRWRVILLASPEPPHALAFVDDFFVTPVAALTAPSTSSVAAERALHLVISALDRDRFLVVDRHAGVAAVSEALKPLLKAQPRGEVSRLASDPPYLLEDDGTLRRDISAEDREVVRRCANGHQPKNFAKEVAAAAYPDLARKLGYRAGRSRITRHAGPTPDGRRWAGIVKAISKRWPHLKRALGPFAVRDTATISP